MSVFQENPDAATIRSVLSDLRERLEKHETHPLGPTYLRMDLDFQTRDVEDAIESLDEGHIDFCDACDEKNAYIRQLKVLLNNHEIDVPKASYEVGA